MKSFAFYLTLLCVCGAISGAVVPGAPSPITDKNQLNALTKKVSNYLVEYNNQGFGANLELIRTRSATVQVVAGVRYELMVDLLEDQEESQCKLGLWEKSWENFAQIDIECGNGQRKYSFVTVHKEQKIDNEVQSDEYEGATTRVTDAKQLAALNKNLTRYFKEFSSQGFVQLKLVKVESATMQVMTDAVRYAVVADLLEDKQESKCNVALLQKQKMNYVKMDVECGNGQRKYSFVTVHTEEIDNEIQSDEIQFAVGSAKAITDANELAQLGKTLATYLKEFSVPGFTQFELVQLKSATKQTVNGVKYVILADIMENEKKSACKITLMLKPKQESYVKLDIECGQNKYSFTRSFAQN